MMLLSFTQEIYQGAVSRRDEHYDYIRDVSFNNFSRKAKLNIRKTATE